MKESKRLSPKHNYLLNTLYDFATNATSVPVFRSNEKTEKNMKRSSLNSIRILTKLYVPEILHPIATQLDKIYRPLAIKRLDLFLMIRIIICILER